MHEDFKRMDDDQEDPDRTDSLPGLPPPAADPEATQADLTAGIESLRASWTTPGTKRNCAHCARRLNRASA